MRKLITLAVILPLAWAVTGQQTNGNGSARLEFQTEEHYFGEIPENGRKVSFDYVFSNTGDCPLVITRTITSCKCIGTSYTKKPVPPGGKGVITVTYDPKKQLGVFYKAIQVYANTEEERHIIIAKGEVVPQAGN